MRRLLCLTSLLLSASTAHAQTIPARGFVLVNGAYQLTTNDFRQDATFPANAEDATYATDYTVDGGAAFDVAGGAVIWRHLGIGVGVTRFSRSTPTALNGSVPHPFFFNRPRSVNGQVSGLKREELVVNAQARIVAPVGDRFQVMAFGGPSFFQVKQGIVNAFTWTDSYPYDTAAFGAADTVNAKGSKLGFNVGGDVAYFFTRQVGIGGTVQFATATIELSRTGGQSEDVKAGGATTGFGLRLRF
jgi:hypothetical protein